MARTRQYKQQGSSTAFLTALMSFLACLWCNWRKPHHSMRTRACGCLHAQEGWVEYLNVSVRCSVSSTPPLREKEKVNMDTTIVLSEQSTSQLTFTSICESSSAGLSGLENGNGIDSSNYAEYRYSSTKNGGTLPRKAEPEGASSADTLSRSQKLESSEGGEKLGGDAAERRYKLCLRAEIVGLCVVIVIVWGLLLLPIVFYHLPVASVSIEPSHIEEVWFGSMFLSQSTLPCTVRYSGGVAYIMYSLHLAFHVAAVQDFCSKHCTWSPSKVYQKPKKKKKTHTVVPTNKQSTQSGKCSVLLHQNNVSMGM